jgi:hypothetical protein
MVMFGSFSDSKYRGTAFGNEEAERQKEAGSGMLNCLGARGLRGLNEYVLPEGRNATKVQPKFALHNRKKKESLEIRPRYSWGAL